MFVKSLVALFFALSATASFNPNQPNYDVANELEGVSSCGSATDLLKLDELTLTPDPPKKGSKVNIAFKGELKDTITPGAKLNIKVKWGIIQVIDKTYDFCEEAKKFGASCPMYTGPQSLSQSLDVPSSVPSVSSVKDPFTLNFNVYP
jgi:hypothetical protein